MSPADRRDNAARDARYPMGMRLSAYDVRKSCALIGYRASRAAVIALAAGAGAVRAAILGILTVTTADFDIGGNGRVRGHDGNDGFPATV